MDGVFTNDFEEFKIINLFKVIKYAVKREEYAEGKWMYAFHSILPHEVVIDLNCSGIALEETITTSLGDIINEEPLRTTDQVKYEKTNKVLYENILFSLNHMLNIYAVGKANNVSVNFYLEDNNEIDVVIHLSNGNSYQRIRMGIQDPNYQSLSFQSPDTYFKYLLEYEKIENEDSDNSDED